MKLFASILTTAAITGSIWGLLLTQPATANPNLNQKHSTQHITPNQKKELTPLKDQHYLRGVSQTTPLQNVPQLWEKFYNQYGEDNPLPASVDRIFVLYQDFNIDFSSANITIGYDVKKRLTDNSHKLPPAEQTQLLLEKGKHNTEALTKAWDRINFQRDLTAVVETHYLNQYGLPESSQVSVYYKQ